MGKESKKPLKKNPSKSHRRYNPSKSHRRYIHKKKQNITLKNVVLKSKSQSLDVIPTKHSLQRSLRLRIIPYNADIISEYNKIAEDTIPIFTELAATVDNRIRFIFLFAGNAYIEQCFISKIRTNPSIIIESICFVDLSYTHDDETAIRAGFPGLKCTFYGLDNLSSIAIHPNSICMGFRPQISGNRSRELDDFIARYYSINEMLIYLIKFDKSVAIARGENIQTAMDRLYAPIGNA
jgi:hypothetical protein